MDINIYHKLKNINIVNENVKFCLSLTFISHSI